MSNVTRLGGIAILAVIVTIMFSIGLQMISELQLQVDDGVVNVTAGATAGLTVGLIGGLLPILMLVVFATIPFVLITRMGSGSPYDPDEDEDDEDDEDEEEPEEEDVFAKQERERREWHDKHGD